MWIKLLEFTRVNCQGQVAECCLIQCDLCRFRQRFAVWQPFIETRGLDAAVQREKARVCAKNSLVIVRGRVGVILPTQNCRGSPGFKIRLEQIRLIHKQESAVNIQSHTMHVQRRAGELRFRLKRLSIQPHDLLRLIKRIALDAHIDCIRSSQNLQQLPVKRALLRKLLPIRADFDDPFGKEQIICAATAVKSARLFRVDFCQRYRTEDCSVSIIGRDRITPLRRVHSDRFSVCVKIERRISTCKQRQRIAAFTHAIQIF